MDDVEEMTRLAFKRCANKFGIEETTVRDKCTRQKGIKTAKFYQLVKVSLEKNRIEAGSSTTDRAKTTGVGLHDIQYGYLEGEKFINTYTLEKMVIC